MESRGSSVRLSGIKYLLLVSLFEMGMPVTAQKLDHGIVRTLDSVIAKMAQDYDIPGVSVGIVRKSEVVYLKNQGTENILSQKPISSNTVFNTGSISKVFTATAIMQLHELGLINLKTPVYKYGPYFDMVDQDFRKITIEHLLAHKGGLPGDHSAHVGAPYFGEDAIKNYIIKLYDRSLESQPGVQYSYSNTGYVLLSAVIEEVSKMGFEAYMGENILKPIGMYSSTFNADKNKIINLTARHVIGADFNNAVYGSLTDTRWKTGAGGLTTTIHDMCLFAKVLLNGGSTGEYEIISEKSLEAMWTRGENTGDKGLAWSIYHVWGGKKLVDHGGNSIGYSAEFAIMPDDSIAVVVFCNNRNGAEWPITGAVLKTMLGRDLKAPVYHPDYMVQKKLREEGSRPALEYLATTLEEDIDEVSCYDITLLAYRLIQGGGEQNLEISREICELLAMYYPDTPMVNEILGEVYFKLAVKQYRYLVKKEPASWTGKKMLELLGSIDVEFF